MGQGGTGLGGGRLTFWRVQSFLGSSKSSVPQKMGTPAQTLLIQVQPRTQQPPELISNEGSQVHHRPAEQNLLGTGAPRDPGDH